MGVNRFAYIIIILNLFAYLFSNYAKKIGPKGLNFSGFVGAHPGEVTYNEVW